MLDNFKFHHIGIAVYDIDKTAGQYIDAGFEKTPTIYDPVQNVNICFLNKEGHPQIELLAPVDDNSPVTQTLQKSGVTPYHFCYTVEDIDEAVASLRKKRFLPVIRPVEALALENHRICFLYNKDMGLIELIEGL